ncbi:hypothetical protein FRX31_015639 [Thalictrum thalictroides]|uniref:Uncharacterized protein n=1 Tax=Thalictrum thalictroides TaxID=46969 RepID=A0A7J6WEG8_THATH|nr:hypothetical protein FRX31_015639 [Thalictrum thalictroides]
MNFETDESSYHAHPGTPNKIQPPLERMYGDVVETIQIANAPPQALALEAIVVFLLPVNVDAILNEEDRVRLVINRKRVWARRYVPRDQE